MTFRGKHDTVPGGGMTHTEPGPERRSGDK